mgnify:CR=1 FL=1|jgi:hypothetical protein
MATFTAFKNLGKAIVADIAAAKNGVVESAQQRKAERQIVSKFKEILREDPAACAKAFAVMTADKPKQTRKPRAAKTA